jgi:hypothetical protein
MTDRKVFADSVTPLPDQPGLTPHGLMIHAEKPTDRNEKMTLLFSVGISASAQADLGTAPSLGASTIRGRRIVKVEPLPGSLSTVMSPPII